MPLLEKFLYVRKSSLPNAGKGLFTKKEIPKGTRIVEYKGKLRVWKDVKHLDGYNGYLMFINRQAVIDALPAIKTFGRYANDASGFVKVKGLRNNAEYVSEGNRCFIESLRKIGRGEEIFVGYGRDFWKLQRKIRSEKSKQ
jgi:hypothetical protein